ncbi:MAG: hypothetical protein MUC95_01765 [Spirochaetes bacterium]|nr:hypothetical protein [Spirochaetota bacterium]
MFLFAGDLYAGKEKKITDETTAAGSPARQIKKIVPQERNFCYECHIGLSGRLKEPCIDIKESVHSQEGPQCDSCHGGNPNLFDAKQAKSDAYNYIGKPVAAEIPYYCGKVECHNMAYFQFQKSAHYGSLKETGEPNCTTCHGAHNIKQSARETMAIGSCIKCHEMNYATEIVTSVFDIESEFDQIQKSITFLEEKNIDVGDVNLKLSEIKRIFYQLVHVFSQDLMVFSKRIIDLEAKALHDELGKKVAMLRRIDTLYMLTFITVTTTIILFCAYFLWSNYKRKQEYHRKTESQHIMS